MDSKTKKKLPWRILLALAILVVMIIAFCPPVRNQFKPLICDYWTGFCADTTKEESVETNAKGQIQKRIEIIKYQSGKTLWDWLGLAGTLAIPVLIVILGNQFQRKDQRRVEEQARTEKDIANDNLRDAALEAYIDRMSELLLDGKLISSNDNDPCRDVARTRTLTVLRRLKDDGERKARVLHFLYDAGLLDSGGKAPFIDLRDADFSGANLIDVTLHGANLMGANLEGTNLKKANLMAANLEGAILVRTNLMEANLYGATLNEANLNGAILVGTHLNGATLNEAHLIDANLEGAILVRAKLVKTNLEGANLIDTKLMDSNLEGAILVRAIMNGANLNGVKLERAKLRDANLNRADLEGANLNRAILVKANLEGANLNRANLEGANLEEAFLKGARNCTPDQIKSAENWEKAHYDRDFRQQLGLPPEPLKG